MIDEKKLIKKINDYCSEFDESLEENESFDGYNIKSICMSVIAEILDLIQEQPKVGEWIPVEEKLPENCSSVLMYSVLQGVEQGCYNPSTDTWIMFRWGQFTGKVTHWRPLPDKPYEFHSKKTRKKLERRNRMTNLEANKERIRDGMALCVIAYLFRYGEQCSLKL